MRRTGHFAAALSCLLCGVLSLVSPSAIAGNQADVPCGAFDLYDRVLPVSPDADEERGAREVIVVRYIPGDTTVDREFRVIIRVSRDGRYGATLRKPRGSSLLAQMRALQAERALTCGEVISKLSIEETEVVDQAPLRAMSSDLDRIRVPARQVAAIYLDVPQYSFVDRAGMNSASYVLYGPTLQDRHPHPLIEWCHSLPARLSKQLSVIKKSS